MSKINIITNNMSRALRNSRTYVDNYVYVPGTAITGDWKNPMIFESLNDFINTCGDHGVEGSYTFEYVTGLLNAGLPVIFRRIARQRQDEEVTPEVEATLTKAGQATYTLTHTVDEDTIKDIVITEKYGGTFGNDVKVTIRNQKNTYWFDVYYKTSLLESLKVCSYTDAELETESTTHVIAARIIAALPVVTLNSTRINVALATGTGAATVETLVLTTGTYSLVGGTDFPDNLVKPEIVTSYEKITDKILYQPKYVTSGGYADDDLTISTSIATAMKNLTLTRGDCVALIDIQLGIDPDQQQTQAEAVSYTQTSNSQQIPSAAIMAPWQYMQVGNTQEWMPASYAYLTRVGADLSSGGNSYTPKAGISNGQVANIIRPEFDIGSDLSEAWQEDGEVQLNPIMRLQGGRYIIAGNSTLLLKDADEENALSELSATMTIIDIKRFVYNLAMQLQYSYNSATTFETFSLRTSDYLDKMMTEGAISDYDIANVSDSDEPRKMKIRLDVYLTPTIKAFEIYLNIAYGEVTVGGEA